MLHITNGDAVQLSETDIGGDVLAWRDVLHEGPVPLALPMPDLSRVRAEFIAGRGWGPPEEVTEGFAARDAVLASAHEHHEVVLWFEHDLYDQLQLIQILDWFLTHRRPHRLSLISISKFPGMGWFKGLGELNPEQLGSLFPARTRVTLAEMKAASEAWISFRSTDPRDLEWAIANPSTDLPYLEGALVRHLEQFPSTTDGLSRTERQILEHVASGIGRVEDMFVADQDREERVFMGDTTFQWYVDHLAQGPEPLLDGATGYQLTPTGVAVLAAKADACALRGIDRWLGGVHLTGPDPAFRWDAKARKIVPRAHRN